MKKKIIEIFGGGVVAGGVVDILTKLNNNNNIVIKTMCVKNINKKRDFDSIIQSNGIIVTDNINTILNDDEINMYVELIGDNPALTIMNKAIDNKIPFITANKSLLSKYLETIQNYNGVRYEAAVCGGIPIINTIKNTYMCDKIYKISGIMNGTTNYILSRMEKEKCAYKNVLKDAQELGYAEADPTADIKGYDAKVNQLYYQDQPAVLYK